MGLNGARGIQVLIRRTFCTARQGTAGSGLWGLEWAEVVLFEEVEVNNSY